MEIRLCPTGSLSHIHPGDAGPVALLEKSQDKTKTVSKKKQTKPKKTQPSIIYKVKHKLYILNGKSEG